MLEGLRSWWTRKRKERADTVMLERAVVVSINDTGIFAAYPYGKVQRIDWPEVEQVTIETNDGGPWGVDIWWILTGTDRTCRYPGGATGEQEALAEFPKHFPQFDHEAVIQAMVCTSNAQFLCWKREGTLKTITIPTIPDASLDLATKLKERLGWLDSPEEIQRILGCGTHTKIVEHLRPESVRSITDHLAALGLDYTVWDDSEAPE